MSKSLTALLLATAFVSLTSCQDQEIHEEALKTYDGSVIKTISIAETRTEYDMTKVIRLTHRTYIPLEMAGPLTNKDVAQTVNKTIEYVISYFNLEILSWELDGEYSAYDRVRGVWLNHKPKSPQEDFPDPLEPQIILDEA